MWHVWIGLGLLTGAGSAAIAVNPNAADSPVRVGVSPLDLDPLRIGVAGLVTLPRIGSGNSHPAAAVGERAVGAPDRRVGSSSVRAARRRIG